MKKYLFLFGETNSASFEKPFFPLALSFPSYNIFSYISSLWFVLPTHYESQAITTLFFLPLFQSEVMMPQNGVWLIEWAAEFINHGWYSTLGLAKNNRYLRHPSYTRWVSRLPVSGPYQGEWQIHLVPYERLYTDFSFGIVWHCIYLHAAKPVLWRSFGYLVKLSNYESNSELCSPDCWDKNLQAPCDLKIIRFGKLTMHTCTGDRIHPRSKIFNNCTSSSFDCQDSSYFKDDVC